MHIYSASEEITLDENESFTIGEDVLYCGNGVLFVGSLCQYEEESSTVVVVDSYTRIWYVHYLLMRTRFHLHVHEFILTSRIIIICLAVVEC